MVAITALSHAAGALVYNQCVQLSGTLCTLFAHNSFSGRLPRKSLSVADHKVFTVLENCNPSGISVQFSTAAGIARRRDDADLRMIDKAIICRRYELPIQFLINRAVSTGRRNTSRSLFARG